MKYTNEEIKEAHGKVKKDLDNGYKDARGISLALECQEIIFKYLTSIMTEEEKKPEEEEKKEEELDVDEATK